jgi:hypothetical protein
VATSNLCEITCLLTSPPYTRWTKYTFTTTKIFRITCTTSLTYTYYFRCECAGCCFYFERCNLRLLFSNRNLIGMTALHWSSLQDHIEICKLLVESQADVNAKDKQCDARPILHMLLNTIEALCFYFQRHNARLLFSERTPLHYSSGNGHSKICMLLVECEADVNAKTDSYDARPLHIRFETNAGCRVCFQCYLMFYVMFVLIYVMLVLLAGTLPCICLLNLATWKFASSWSSVGLT